MNATFWSLLAIEMLDLEMPSSSSESQPVVCTHAHTHACTHAQDRVGIALTLLLALNVFQIILSEAMPKTGNYTDHKYLSHNYWHTHTHGRAHARTHTICIRACSTRAHTHASMHAGAHARMCACSHMQLQGT